MRYLAILDDDHRHRVRLTGGLGLHYGQAARGFPLRATAPVTAELRREPPDVVFVALRAPGDVAALARVRGASGRPVIALGDAGRQLAAIAAGADAAVPGDASPGVLHALAGAVLRRTAPVVRPRSVLVGPIGVDLDARTVTVHGRPVTLTRAEFDLLACLVDRPGAVVPRTGLAARLGGSRSVDVLLSRLRAKLGEDARAPEYLHTLRGRGVVLAARRAVDGRAPGVPAGVGSGGGSGVG